MRISDWSSDVCSSDLLHDRPNLLPLAQARRTRPSSGAEPRIYPVASRPRAGSARPGAAYPPALWIIARALLFAARRRGDRPPAPAVRLRNAHLRSVRERKGGV